MQELQLQLNNNIYEFILDAEIPFKTVAKESFKAIFQSIYIISPYIITFRNNLVFVKKYCISFISDIDKNLEVISEADLCDIVDSKYTMQLTVLKHFLKSIDYLSITLDAVVIGKKEFIFSSVRWVCLNN